MLIVFSDGGILPAMGSSAQVSVCWTLDSRVQIAALSIRWHKYKGATSTDSGNVC